LPLLRAEVNTFFGVFMSLILNIVQVVQLLSALGMIGLILVQHGKGADMGAAFGSGSSGSLFGASGGANFLSRTTGVLATVFFVCTLALAYFGNLRPVSSGSVLEGAVIAPVTTDAANAIPAPAAEPASGAAQIPTK
jgi:preprotein translocase subunit SecG